MNDDSYERLCSNRSKYDQKIENIEKWDLFAFKIVEASPWIDKPEPISFHYGNTDNVGERGKNRITHSS